ncbi:ABC transporter ATP-binding protein [Terrihabitans rhizophilus]|uniref:ABC transporter ATP-binding protein n=1 Tax=Terrihabitans rhizophilus TaxID=3092662 RepID=A0ABU4RJT3_9HYPH|nr:ABC transporter ATP-binding protein [Terrihabitans sp. PJ23]MDX6805085.1 ABC transporter ATP-binding protein [Terrihabitans sp. PJ23]
MEAGVLRVRDLSTGYRNRDVVRGLSLPDLAAGQTLSLLGPNAAGKSTLLRALAGLQPARGSIELGGTELIGLPLAEHARRVTYMPQTLPQRVALTVLEAVIGALRATPPEGIEHGTDAITRRAVEVLERIGIAHLAMEGLDHLSGGQRQLASLAQALVRRPRVLLLDEPTSALDLNYQLRVMQLVREAAREWGMTVIMVLHDLALAARWSDRIVLLSHGTVAAAGNPVEALTPDVLARVYNVRARVETCSRGTLQILVDDVFTAPDKEDT